MYLIFITRLELKRPTIEERGDSHVSPKKASRAQPSCNLRWDKCISYSLRLDVKRPTIEERGD